MYVCIFLKFSCFYQICYFSYLLLPFLEDVTEDSEDEAFGVGPPPDQFESG